MARFFKTSYEEDIKRFSIGIKEGLIELVIILSLGAVGCFFGGKFLENKMIQTQRKHYQDYLSNPKETRALKPSRAKYWDTHKPSESDPMSYVWAGLGSCALSALAVYPITNVILRRRK